MTKQSLIVASLFAAAITASGCAQLSAMGVPGMRSTSTGVGPSSGLAGSSAGGSSESAQEEMPQSANFTGPVGAANRVGNGRDFLDTHGWFASAYERALAVNMCLSTTSPDLAAEVFCSQVPYDAEAAIADIGKSGGFGPGYARRLKDLVRAGESKHRAATAHVAELAAKDPGLAKVVAIVRANWQLWDNPTGARVELQANLAQMIEAASVNRRSAFDGCLASTGAAWGKALAKTALPSIDDRDVPKNVVFATLATPEGALAFRAYHACIEGLDGTLPASLNVGFSRNPSGPFAQAEAMLVAQQDKILFDDRSLKIQSFLNRQRSDDFNEPSYISIGRVASLTPRDGKIEVDFAPTKEKRNLCQEWVPTNRVERIVNGKVEYVHTCKRREMKLLDNTPFPTSVSPTFAAGLAVGDYAVVGGGVVWMATRKDKPSMALNGIIK